MSYVILRSINGRPRTLTIWSGRVISLLGVLHLGIFLAQSLPHVPGWIAGDLRGEEVTGFGEITESAGWFWSSVGSFAVPLFLVGLLITRLARSGHATPVPVYWILIGWLAIGGFIYEPGGFPVGIAVCLVLIAADRSRRRQTPELSRPQARPTEP